MTQKEADKIQKLIDDIGAMNATSNAPRYEKARAEFQWHCVGKIVDSIEKLNNSIDENSKSNQSIASKVFWLNIVLTVATVIGSIATVAIALNGQ